MTQVYFAGGEDSDFIGFGGGGSVDTNTVYFRSAYARCALVPANATTAYYQSGVPFSASAFWFTGRHGASSGVFYNSNGLTLGFADASNIRRLRIRNAGGTSAGPWAIEKINAAGTVTQLGVNTLWQYAINGLDKLDIFVNYSASGQFTVYLNGVQVFTFSGDVTTDGVTTLASVQLLGDGMGTSAGGWSEVIVSDSDTRSMSLQTLAPVANGNTHNFDTGSPAAANVNEVTLNDGTLDGSSVAGQIDEYTIPALVTGTFSILAVGVSARAIAGTTGPQHMDLGVRQASADYWSADKALTAAFANYQNWWTTDPSTSAAWASLPVNIGVRSVT